MPHRPSETDPPYPLTTADRDRLIARWMPRVERMSRRYFAEGFEREDWAQEARLLLVVALGAWEPVIGVPCAAWVMRYVRDELWRRLQYLSRRHRLLGPSLDDREDAWEERLHGARNPARDLDLVVALERLTDDQRAVLQAYYGEERTDPEIGCILGISADRVARVRHLALRALRDLLGVPETAAMAGHGRLTAQQLILLDAWRRLGGDALRGPAAADAKVQAAMIAGYSGCRAALRAAANRALAKAQ